MAIVVMVLGSGCSLARWFFLWRAALAFDLAASDGGLLTGLSALLAGLPPGGRILPAISTSSTPGWSDFHFPPVPPVFSCPPRVREDPETCGSGFLQGLGESGRLNPK
jgi:hypothetical protein